MNIFIGWWMIPTILTVIFYVIASRYKKPISTGYNIDIEGPARYGIATILSLVAWLIYAFAT